VLPLRCENKALGITLLFIDPDWVPDEIELDFMSELGQALSGLVLRTLMNETLRVREVELEDARTDAIRRLGTASEYRDNETGMHIMRMTHYATSIAKALGLSVEERELLAICAPMHDVGKIGISDTILLKPGRLTPEEFEVMKTHTEIGESLLDGSDELISAARDIAAYHHERWDGQGYPKGLKGNEIPILARICAIADVFDALTSTRPYKSPWPFDEAIAYVRNASGSTFDPAVVAAFERALPEIKRIRELYRDDIIDPNEIVELPASAYREQGWVGWDESLSVGIDVIDEHHRYLFDLTNDLFDVVTEKRGARDVARVLKALEQYAQVHFRAEERMMNHHGYSEKDRQHAQHRHFEAKLDELYAELHDNPLTAQFDVLIFLREWLIKHIRIEDAKLIELVAEPA
jgi:hemerythrin-like metal-binding protein